MLPSFPRAINYRLKINMQFFMLMVSSGRLIHLELNKVLQMGFPHIQHLNNKEKIS
ncbi:MAG TPA: hypothetical protein VG890_03975 [Puia sp.]|nr:hypothetical protein [Puia sp.]